MTMICKKMTCKTYDRIIYGAAFALIAVGYVVVVAFAL